MSKALRLNEPTIKVHFTVAVTNLFVNPSERCNFNSRDRNIGFLIGPVIWYRNLVRIL